MHCTVFEYVCIHGKHMKHMYYTIIRKTHTSIYEKHIYKHTSIDMQSYQYIHNCIYEELDNCMKHIIIYDYIWKTYMPVAGKHIVL